MPLIDSFLNKITMYKLAFYGLLLLALISIAFGFLHLIPYDGLPMIGSLVLIFASTWGVDMLVSRMRHSVRNLESSWITALILFFLLAPIASLNDVWVTIAAGVLAAVSKYLFAIRKRHIFNPVAVSALILSIAGTGMVIWWIATPVLVPFVLALGLLVIRKIRRFDLFLAFVITEAVVALGYGVFVFHTSLLDTLSQNFLSFPVIFFGTIMLSEPFTTPPTRRLRIIYGAATGLLFAIPFHAGSIYSTPELALIVANIFAYAVSSRQRIMLTLKSKQQLSANVHEFVFAADQQARFLPGQYMEWTLPHEKIDIRGNRRYFTIASAPHEPDIRLGIRISENGSSFKRALATLPVGGRMSATSISGGFTLPADHREKVLAIAGGIGVTPFISMLRSMIASGERRDMVLVYAANTEEDFAYRDVLNQAAQIGIRTMLIAGKPVDKEFLAEKLPDYAERTWYLSGPQGMVEMYWKLALSLGIHRTHIKTDYFPGL